MIRPEVRSGSNATEMGSQRHVWFTPDSDQTADMASGPVRAKTGLAWALMDCADVLMA